MKHFLGPILGAEVAQKRAPFPAVVTRTEMGTLSDWQPTRDRWLLHQMIIFIEVRVRSSGLFIFRKVYRKGLLRFSS